jgi:hypothetical protein
MRMPGSRFEQAATSEIRPAQAKRLSTTWRVRGICIFKPAIQVEEVASLLAGAALENAAPSTDPNRVTASIICFKTAFYEIDLGQSIYINSD